MKLNVTGIFYTKSDMDAAVKSVIEHGVPSGKALVSQEPTKLSFSADQADAASERARISIHADVMTKPTTADGWISKEAIAGKPEDDAKSQLEQMDGVERADISISPSWARRLPQPEHISVKIR